MSSLQCSAVAVESLIDRAASIFLLSLTLVAAVGNLILILP